MRTDDEKTAVTGEFAQAAPDLQPPARSKLHATFLSLKTSKLVQGIFCVVLTVGLAAFGVYAGVKVGPVYWPTTPDVVAPDVIEAPNTPMAGETDAVLSLQILRNGQDPVHQCTAVLIDDPQTQKDDEAGEWALSAAHCVTKPPPKDQKIHDLQTCADAEAESKARSKLGLDHPETAPFVVRGDTTLYTRGGQVAKVAERYIPSGWNWGHTAGKPDDDLVLLRLAHPVNIKPMALAAHDQAPGAFAVAYGWSVGPDNGCKTKLSPALQQFPVRVDTCPAEPELAKTMCAGTPNDAAGPCGGTSGGPIVSLDGNEHPTLYGAYVSSRGLYCGQGPMFFESGPDYRQWMLDEMATHA